MKLNKEGKNELRAKIVEQLQEVPDGQRIHIDKDVLESLLFEEIVISAEKGIIVKAPVWSGEFLRKIDLSEVDFTNVSWLLLGDNDWFSSIVYEDIKEKMSVRIDENIWDEIDNIEYSNVDYSYTNARIDLTSSFESKYSYGPILLEVNFEGMDLSNVALPDTEERSFVIARSNISNTKLRVPAKIQILASESNLSGINLSEKTINGVQGILYKDYDSSVCTDGYHGCNLFNTGLNITIDSNEYNKFYTLPKEQNYHNAEGVMQLHKAVLKKAMSEDWVGCYVNGKRVFSPEERQASARGKLEEYEKLKTETLNSILGPVEEQISSMKK